MRWCSPNNIGLGITMKASARSFTIMEKALAISSGRSAGTSCSCIPKVRAASSIAFTMFAIVRSPYAWGCKSAATRTSPGTTSLSSCRRLGRVRADKGRPSNITARPRQAYDQFVAYRVGHDPCDDRDGVRRLLGCAGCRRAPSDNDIDLQRNQFSRQRGEPIRFPIPVSLLYGQVLSYDVTEFV